MDVDPKLYEHLSNKERMLQGYPYNARDEELVKDRQRTKEILRQYNALDDGVGQDARDALLKTLFHPDTCNKLFLEPNFRCDYGSNITFGENAVMNFDCCILDALPVKIGKNFMAGPGVQISTKAQPLEVEDRRAFESGKPVTIGDDVWIGGMAVICPGVTIGNGVVVGAGSVVTTDVPDYCVVAGNPAKIIKRVEKPNYDEETK